MAVVLELSRPDKLSVTLVDRNVEDWDESSLESADILLIGAMMPQQRDCLGMIRKAHERGKIVVGGGPDPTNSPHIYDEADHLVLGEAEVTLPPAEAGHQDRGIGR